MGTNVTIDDSVVRVVTPEGKELSVPAEEVFGALHAEQGGEPRVLPSGVRLERKAGSLTVWVYEISPGIRRLKWIKARSRARYGPGAEYRMVSLSLPYLVLFVVFENGVLSHWNECFFRVQPIEDERADSLYFPALLNCSKFLEQEEHPLSWICTQHVQNGGLPAIKDERERMLKGLELLRGALLETGFNFSSEDHEYSSWYTESRNVDKRIATVEAWEKASKADPGFALEVPWLETGKTIEEVIERIFALRRVRPRGAIRPADIVRVVVHRAR